MDGASGGATMGTNPMKLLLTTKDCADELCVSRFFVLKEIALGRLPVLSHKRPPGVTRKMYRIRIEDFQAYKETYWSTGDSA